MLNLHLFKTMTNEKGDLRRIRCYSSVRSIVEAMETCLESIGIIHNILRGIDLEAFVNDRAVLDRCAINYQIIGNQIGMLNPDLILNHAMESAYAERNIIAHRYGNKTRDDRRRSFDYSMFWNDINRDIGDLESGCREVIHLVTSQNVVFSPNRKLFRRHRGTSSLERLLDNNVCPFPVVWAASNRCLNQGLLIGLAN